MVFATNILKLNGENKIPLDCKEPPTSACVTPRIQRKPWDDTAHVQFKFTKAYSSDEERK